MNFVINKKSPSFTKATLSSSDKFIHFIHSIEAYTQFCVSESTNNSARLSVIFGNRSNMVKTLNALEESDDFVFVGILDLPFYRIVSSSVMISNDYDTGLYVITANLEKLKMSERF